MGASVFIYVRLGGSLPTAIPAMLGSDSAWKSVANFCEDVMIQKEAAEGIRERTDPIRRRGH